MMNGSEKQIARATQILEEASAHLVTRIEYYRNRVETEGSCWLRHLAAYERLNADLCNIISHITDAELVIKQRMYFDSKRLDQQAVSFANNRKFIAEYVEK